MFPRALASVLFLATLPWLLPVSVASMPVDTGGATEPTPVGGFSTVLRTYQESGGGLHYDLLRLDADEGFANYFFQVDAGPDAGSDAAWALLRVRRIGTQDYICQGPAAGMSGFHVQRDCDDLRVLHHFEVEWAVNDPASVITLRGY